MSFECRKRDYSIKKMYAFICKLCYIYILPPHFFRQAEPLSYASSMQHTQRGENMEIIPTH